jgi:hypothetical protein
MKVQEIICSFLIFQKAIQMRTTEIIDEIKRLPIPKRIWVIEQAVHSIRKEDDKIQMQLAVDLLLDDYQNDKELTAFIN